MAKSTWRSTTGVIPLKHFENEFGPPRPLESFMSEAAIAEFDAETERLRQELLNERAAKRKRKTKS